MFINSEVVYRVVDNRIILTKTQKTLSNTAVQKNVTITGVVRDVSGEPLPGVNVYEKTNPTNGVITGIDGKLSH